jgi:hypothetical protein
MQVKGIRISHLNWSHLIYYTNGARPLGGKAKQSGACRDMPKLQSKQFTEKKVLDG